MLNRNQTYIFPVLQLLRPSEQALRPVRVPRQVRPHPVGHFPRGRVRPRHGTQRRDQGRVRGERCSRQGLLLQQSTPGVGKGTQLQFRHLLWFRIF